MCNDLIQVYFLTFEPHSRGINYEPKGGGLGNEEGDEERWKGLQQKTKKNIMGKGNSARRLELT
jgi:hypothetical protein